MIYTRNFSQETTFSRIIKIIKMLVVSVCFALLLTVGAGLAIGFRPVKVVGWSMQPAIMYGDIIIIKKVPLDHLNVGDVITFGPVGMTTHRIVDIDGATITTKGDPNPSNDTPINYSNVYGKVIYKSTFLGKVVSFIIKSTNIISLVLVFSAGYLACKIKETYEIDYDYET